MKRRINVTQDEIEHGVRLSCGNCPVALAIAKLVRDEIHVLVDSWSVTFFEPTGNGYMITHKRQLPDSAMLWIIDYDSSMPVKPFSFTLDLPKGLLR